MSRSRRCCCCLKLWQNGSLVSIKSINEAIQTFPIVFGSGFGGQGVYDALNRYWVGVLYNTSTTTWKYIIYDEVAKAERVIFTKTGPSSSTFWRTAGVAPQLNQLLYSHIGLPVSFNDTKPIEYWGINYDGTGDAKLFEIPPTTDMTSTLINGPPLAPKYNQDTDEWMIGVNEQGTLSSVLKLRFLLYAVKSDGSNLREIYRNTVTWDGVGGGLQTTEHDGVNDKYIFIEQATVSGTTVTKQVKRCDYDGSNVTLLEDFSTETQYTGIPSVSTSYKDRCYYVYFYKPALTQTQDTYGGFYQVDFNFQKVKKILHRHKVNFDIIRADLACGFEKVGPNFQG